MYEKSKETVRNSADAVSDSAQKSNFNGTDSGTNQATSSLAGGTPTNAAPAGQPATILASTIVKIRLRPELLARFPAGESITRANSQTGSLSTPQGDLTTEHFEKPKVFQQLLFAKGSKKRNTPVGPRGTVMLLKDNPNLDRTTVRKGNPEPHKLSLTFKDTNNNIHKRFFPEKSANKWDDSKWISDANKWRGQAFRRSFRHDPTFKGHPVRVKYSMRETNSLKAELKSRMEKSGQPLRRREWKEVANLHNERYEGTKVFAGEKLANGGIARSTQTIQRRSPSAIQALFERLEDLRSFVAGLVHESNDQNTSIEGNVSIKSEEMEDEKDDEMDDEIEDEIEDEMDEDSDLEANYGSCDEQCDEEGEGVRHSRLEDSSDDKEDDMRPAST